MLDKIWAFILQSSADPEKMSATLKGIIGVGATIFSVGFGMQNIHIPVDQLNPIIDTGIVSIQAVVGAISAISVVWGLIRKLILTFQGKNAAVSAPKVG